MKPVKKKPLKQWLSESIGWSLLSMFIWELIEEGLESLIAYALTSATAIVIAKALTALGIVIATQGIKVTIKVFLFPIIKKFTKKEGQDKLNFLKRIFNKSCIKSMKNWIIANKYTIIMSIIACGMLSASAWFIIGAYWLSAPLWAEISITAGAGLLSAFAVYLLGHEKVINFTNRILLKKLKPEQAKQITDISSKLIEETKLAEEKEKADSIAKKEAIAEAEAELKAKQKAELDKLAEQKLAEKKSAGV